MFNSILLFVIQHPVWTGLIIGGLIVSVPFLKMYISSSLRK